VHIDEEPYNFATSHAAYLARRVGARIVFFTWQNLQRVYPPPFNWFEAYVYRHAAYAIAGNEDAAQVLRAKNYRGPVRVIPQFGVDPAPSLPPRERSGAFVIGFAGRLVAEKGAAVLLRAAASLEGVWELRLAGSGPERAGLEQLARDLQIDARVRLEPWRPSAEMPAFYRELDVLVAPSLTRPNWKEQFGRVLVEAMNWDVPVVGSNCGEIPNVIGDAGVIVPENDPAALGAALSALRRDADRRAELSRRGRERVLARFTQARVAAETVEVYREVVQ
jgi:glycosyltransferase involved in cell wall biosynthesis